jgi:hypothetical protein
MNQNVRVNNAVAKIKNQSRHDEFVKYISHKLRLDVFTDYVLCHKRKWVFRYAIVLPTGKVAIDIHPRPDMHNEAVFQDWRVLVIRQQELCCQKTVNMIMKCVRYKRDMTYL